MIPLRRTVGKIRGVACVASSSSGDNSIRVVMCFGRKAGTSVTTIGIRGQISATLSLLPTRIMRVNIAAGGRRGSRLGAITLCSPSKACRTRFLSGCFGVGIRPHLGHVTNINGIVRFKTGCTVHV